MSIIDTMGDRRFTIAVWVVMALISVVCIISAVTGITPGVAPGRHPPEYLVVSNVAIFLLISVIPVLRLTGVVKMPWWFNFILIGDVYLYSVSLTLGFYLDPGLPWWGSFGHACSSIAVSSLVFLALCLVAAHSKGKIQYGNDFGLLFITFMFSLALGGIWEVMEGYIDIVTGESYMSYGVLDSLGDLRADFAGALAVCIGAAFLLRRQTIYDIAARTHLGRSRP